MKFNFTGFFFLLLVQQSYLGYTQSVSSDSSFNFLEINSFAGTAKRIPFWMQSNQFGIIPKEGPAVSIHAGIEQYKNISGNGGNSGPWRAGGGVEVVSNFSNNTKVLLPQLFATLRFKNWELFAGRKKQWLGLADSTIGSGSYTWSGNTMPIPKTQLGTRGFISLPLTKGWVAFSAFYSEGLFEKNRFVTSELKLHQKALYVRLGKANSHLRLYGGFNHQVQWGGKSPYHTVNGQMPKGLKSYFHVITGKTHATGDDLTHFDLTNRIGNHLGTLDVAMEVDISNSTWFFYRQNIYEDGSLYYFNNIGDGLNGIRFKRKPTGYSAFQITEVVAELLYTKSQGGSVANLNANIRGKDDYFNNAQVRDGWSYYDRTIGTPFITPSSSTKWNWPVDSDFFTSNNRISVWHLGLKGFFMDNIIWTGKFSHSTNYGTYNVPYMPTPKQFSGLISFEAPMYFLGGTILKGSAAADIGKLYTNSYAFSLGLRKDGLLDFRTKKFGYFRY